MAFSRCVLFLFIHSFDNMSVFCANFGASALLCIFNANAMENGLILSKPHSRAGLLIWPFLLESGLFFLNMPSQKFPLKEGLFLNSQWAMTNCEFQTGLHFVAEISCLFSHEQVGVDVCPSPVIPPCRCCGAGSCGISTNADPRELPDGKDFAAVKPSSASNPSHLALKFPCSVTPRWLRTGV